MWLAYILLLFATFFWGATFIFVKITVSLIPVNYFLFLRFGFASLILTPLVIYQYLRSNNDVESVQVSNISRMIRKGLLLGVFLFASFYFQTIGLQLTTPAKAAFITGLSVVFVPLVSIFYLNHKLKLVEIGGVLLALCGTALLTLNFTNISSINRGDLIIIITAISIAFHIILARDLKQSNVLQILWLQFVVMACLALLLSILEQPPEIHWYDEPIVVITLVLTVLFATIYAFATQFYAQNQGIPPTHIGIIFATEPVFALLIDILVGIIPSVQSLVGMICIFSAIIVITKYTTPNPNLNN